MLLDDKAEQKGGMFKLLWQFAKFCGVSVIVFLIQFGLVNGLYFLLKGWTSPLPEFLEYIFNEDVVGK